MWTSWTTTVISLVVKLVLLSLYKLFSKIWAYRDTTCVSILNARTSPTVFWAVSGNAKSSRWLSYSCLVLIEDPAFIYMSFSLYNIKKKVAIKKQKLTLKNWRKDSSFSGLKITDFQGVPVTNPFFHLYEWVETWGKRFWFCYIRLWQWALVRGSIV